MKRLPRILLNAATVVSLVPRYNAVVMNQHAPTHAIEQNRIIAGTATLHRGYRCWIVYMHGQSFRRMVADGPWCFIGEAQTLVQLLNRLDEGAVNSFVDAGELARYLDAHMVRGPGKNKRERGFGL